MFWGFKIEIASDIFFGVMGPKFYFDDGFFLQAVLRFLLVAMCSAKS